MGNFLSKSNVEIVDSSSADNYGDSTGRRPAKRKKSDQDGITRKRQSKSTQIGTTSPIIIEESSFSYNDGTISRETFIENSMAIDSSHLKNSEYVKTNFRRKKKSRRGDGKAFLKPVDGSTTSKPRPFLKSENYGALHLEEENLKTSTLGPDATPKKVRRKRKTPTSPYFTPPAIPTPSPDNALTKKSKISVVENISMPSSLPHFRPTSLDEFGLIQEKLRHEPWKMLVAVIFLNVTTAKTALPLLGQLFERWPTPEALSKGL
jgi:hypothetical protein